MNKMPRVCIAGMGGMGGTFASILSSRPVMLSVVARGSTLQALRENGLVCQNGSEITRHSLRVNDRAPSEIQDLIILSGKSYQLPDLFKTVSHAVGPNTLIIPVLNGLPWWMIAQTNTARSIVKKITHTLDPEGNLGSIPTENIIGCVAYAFAQVTAPGKVNISGSPRFILGNALPGQNTVDRVLTWLEGGEGHFAETPDIKKEIWNKLSLNVATNFLSVLCEGTLKILSSNQDLCVLVRRCLVEIQVLGQDCGIGGLLPIDELMSKVEQGGNHPTSMLQDYLRNKPLELAAMGDVIIRLAHHHGLVLPTTEALVGLTRNKASRRY